MVRGFRERGKRNIQRITTSCLCSSHWAPCCSAGAQTDAQVCAHTRPIETPPPPNTHTHTVAHLELRLLPSLPVAPPYLPPKSRPRLRTLCCCCCCACCRSHPSSCQPSYTMLPGRPSSSVQPIPLHRAAPASSSPRVGRRASQRGSILRPLTACASTRQGRAVEGARGAAQRSNVRVAGGSGGVEGAATGRDCAEAGSAARE
jgi:hypothetical protein